jgi:hypothetical protein
MDTPADYRAAARRLLDALPDRFPRADHRIADAVVGALKASGLAASGDLPSSDAAVAAREAYTALAHLLDESTAGNGAGRLLLLVTADRDGFSPYPDLTGREPRVRSAANAVGTLLQWHSDHPEQVLTAALRAHAHQVRRAQLLGPAEDAVQQPEPATQQPRAATGESWSDVREALRFLGLRSADLTPAESQQPEGHLVTISLSDLAALLNRLSAQTW